MSPSQISTSDRLIDTFSAGQREVLERIAEGAPLGEVLERLVLLVERQASGMACSIVLLDREKRRIRHGAAPSLPEEYNWAINGVEIGPAAGSCGTAAYLGQRVIVEDIDTHPYWAPFKHLALVHGLRACWSSPIFSPTREVLGTFAMYYREPRGPLPQEIAWVDAATHLAAVALCRDAADQALQQSEARYRLMVDTAYEGVWLIDAEGRTTFANRRMGEMLGYTPEEMLGRSMFDFMDEAARTEATANFARRKTGVSEQHEFRFTRKDGSDLWTIVAASPTLDATGQMTSALGMVTDITKRKAAEAALLRSEAEFRTIFESAAMGVALVGSDGAVQKCNPALAELLGYPAAELVGKNIPQLTHPDDLDLGFFQELVAGTRDTYRYEKRYLRKDGQIVWVRVTASAVRENDGRFHFAIGIIEDVTQRHRAEDERARLENQLRQSQKMQSLGTLAGGIAHDFNNILTAIGGNAQLAIADLPPGHPALLSLTEIEKAYERATDLVRQILTFSRPQESKRKIVKLETVVEEALRLLRASLPATITIRTDFASDTPDVAADATQIHQVIMNLGANAAHAIGGQSGALALRLGLFRIGAESPPGSPDLPAGSYARLTITDSGCGMDAATIDRIFEPFFTTKTQGQGTGLGLSVVHGIIKSHGGAITVHSQHGQGTTFHLFFPAARAADIEPAPIPSTAPCGHGERVLYLDDEERLVFLAQRGLEKAGYSFTGFTNPLEAMKAFRAQPTGFDIVVTDLTMPGMNGLDFAAEVMHLRPGMPVLLTTGFLRPQDTDRARRLGLDEYIAKPATTDTLCRALHAALTRGDTAVQP
jgi:PAS domain S-box-containing protein